MTMTVRHEIKSQLAKLLATEDLVVEHKKVETACFNVQTRVLTLPMWEKASNVVYDLLVGHEVGHALYTPDDDWFERIKIPPQFVNIVEDVRIEKMMKRRYPGLAKSFYNGYRELNEQDFFKIVDEDVNEFNLADKVNLQSKVGNFIDITFDEEETEILELVNGAETFADVLIAAEELYKFCKKKQEEETKTPIDNLDSQSGGSEQSESSDLSDQEEGENDTQPQDGEGGGVESDNELEVKTMDSLEEALKDLVDRTSTENVYLELPKVDLKKVVIPNSEIHDRCKEYWSSWIEQLEYTTEDIFGEVDKKFAEFKRSAQKEVNYLVKEFECKKAADSYARATTARTGVLDCTKLHTYKYNEDLFKKVTTLSDGKNHGLVFVLDWSGSMGDVMTDTLKQLFNLVWFCKKVAIPFEVYAFTSEYPRIDYDADGNPQTREISYQKRDGLVQVGEWFSMMNILTSKTNAKVLEEQMKNLFRLSFCFRYNVHTHYNVPYGLNLSGTPLNEALITLHEILPQFQKQNKLQKVQCVVLTDGEAPVPKYHREVQRRFEDEPFMGTAHIGFNAFLRDRKTGNTYSFDCEWHQVTDVLLRNLRDSFKDINFIGIRVLESRDANSFIRRYCGYMSEETDKTISIWRKERTFSIKKSGYHSYFGLSATTLSQDTEFEVAEDATKSQIKSAFVKSLRGKKMNKKVLSEFIELVV